MKYEEHRVGIAVKTTEQRLITIVITLKKEGYSILRYKFPIILEFL